MNKKAFTLIELLAVIAILAILVIIALPNVLSMFNNAKKDIFLTEAKNIYKEVSKKYISETMRGNKITKISNDKNKLDLESNNLEYGISLDNEGKVKYFQVSDGTYCISGKISNLSELTIDKISDGACSEYDDISPEPIYCTFDGNMVQGTEYVNGQYTYRYKSSGQYTNTGIFWTNISVDGWGVQLTDKTSTEPVTSKLCTYINDKPVVSMAYMFLNSQASAIDLSSFNTSKVTDMGSMFWNSQAIILDVSNFDTSKVTNMAGMFYKSRATMLDLSSFDTSKVTSMTYMFFDSKVTALDVSNFDTSKVTDMGAMFALTHVDTIIGLNKFNTSKVINMWGMFTSCSASVIDVSNFDTSNVTNMDQMFYSSGAVILDLSNFDTSKVTAMRVMFSNCKNLKTIYVSSKFNTSSVSNSSDMFKNCTSLVGGQGTVYNSSKINKTYARIDGGTSSPGYFTGK
ncbi:MAG: BspA family leucine-rich repeat surface protein [Tenericutes bacterium]|nr:BspA family leucine-rich repeat surface protein [Mycoplasmatota bacterium]